MNILITGIHGFVGTNFIEGLKMNHSIYGLDIISPHKDDLIKTFSWNDIDNHSLPEVDVIIHLAGKAHDTKNATQSQIYFDINTGLTQKIYDYFLQSSAKKFIFFSSVKAAADSVIGNILTEDVIPSPKGPYGESKIKAEEYIQSRWMNDKLVYILRPCMIHGPGNKGNLNLLFNLVKKGVPWPLGDFENRRSFVSIDNLCFVINGLLIQNISSGIYHIGDDEPLSTNELIKIMSGVMGNSSHIWKMDKRIMIGCARIGTFLHLPFTLDRLKKLTENYVVSNVKIKNALGIEKMPITAKDGLEKTFRSFLK